MDPLVVVGLGNPGSEYQGTRHNVGFLVAEELARRARRSFMEGKGEYLQASCPFGNREMLLVKPTTYMNNSGTAVRDVLEREGLLPERLLVVADDFAIPLGTLRLRVQGSDGGHNGLYSIIYQLQTDEFPRLRCGIRKEQMPPKHEMHRFVLSPFDADEREVAAGMIGKAADAVVDCLQSGIMHAMNVFNT